MTVNEIENLLTKYYNGESSLDDEKRLRDYFTSNQQTPKNLTYEKKLFEYYNFTSQTSKHPVNTTGLLKSAMASDHDHKPRKNHFLKYAFSIAASVLIISSLYFWSTHNIPSHGNIKDTYSDPKLALNQVKMIMQNISLTFNRGTDQLSSLDKFDLALNELQSLNTLNHLPIHAEYD